MVLGLSSCSEPPSRRTLRLLYAAGKSAGERLPNGLWLKQGSARLEPPLRQYNRPEQRQRSPSCAAESFTRYPGVLRLLKMAIGPKHKIWGRRPPASWQAGRRGATTGFAQPVMAQRWTHIEHGRLRAHFTLQGSWSQWTPWTSPKVAKVGPPRARIKSAKVRPTQPLRLLPPDAPCGASAGCGGVRVYGVCCVLQLDQVGEVFGTTHFFFLRALEFYFIDLTPRARPSLECITALRNHAHRP